REEARTRRDMERKDVKTQHPANSFWVDTEAGPGDHAHRRRRCRGYEGIWRRDSCCRRESPGNCRPQRYRGRRSAGAGAHEVSVTAKLHRQRAAPAAADAYRQRRFAQAARWSELFQSPPRTSSSVLVVPFSSPLAHRSLLARLQNCPWQEGTRFSVSWRNAGTGEPPAPPFNLFFSPSKGSQMGPFDRTSIHTTKLALPPLKSLNHLPNDFFVQVGKQSPLCCRKVLRHGSGLGGEASTHLVSLQFVTVTRRNLIRKKLLRCHS
ncbi:hypothetical protein BHE74_00041600, partial [Ensete ventricosum]